MQRFRCRTLGLVTLSMIVAACGLNEREKSVAETNAQIETVYQQSELLARAIYELPDEPNGPASFATVVAAYQGYRTEVNRLNVLIHNLSEVVPELAEHLRTNFDPAAEEALSRCDTAVTVFENAAATAEEYQEALTSLCLCVERYAESVTAVSQAYARLAS
jgi:hypothetical protein